MDPPEVARVVELLQASVLYKASLCTMCAMELSPFESTYVGFLLGNALVKFQTLVCGSKATWLCR